MALKVYNPKTPGARALVDNGCMSRVIDAHTHILPDRFRSEPEAFLERDLTFRALFGQARNSRTAGADELIASMDEAGVDAAVVMGYGWTDLDTARLSNDYLLESAARHPGRLIPCCSVNPLWGDDALLEVRRCAAGGARGVGELHPDTQRLPGVPLDSLAPFMAVARELNLPLVVHASEPVGHVYPGKGTMTPELTLGLAEAFPRNRFVFAHFGGGLPLYAAMPEVAKSIANCRFDAAAAPFLYSSSIYRMAVDAAGADAIMFASDYPLVGQRRALEHLDAAGLDGAVRGRVAGANAAALFGVE